MEKNPEVGAIGVGCGALVWAILGAGISLFCWFFYGYRLSAGWPGQWYVWATAGALVGLTVACLQGYAHRQRSQRIGEVSRQLGLAFTARSTPQQLNRFASHPLPAARDSGWAWNLMEGKVEGVDLAVLDLEDEVVS
jgi:hypothetical protein